MITIPAKATTDQINQILKNNREVSFEKNVKYKITSTIRFQSNTVIDLNGATLRRYTSQPLTRLQDSRYLTGYNGTHDVTIKNGTLEGMSGRNYPYDSNSLCTMFHAKNIRFENITFLDIPGGHAVDCCACQNVTFKNCKFLGYASVGNDFRESIQIDYAYYGGLPTYAKGSACYDMTRCDNITIDGCTWDKSADYPSQYIAIGAHTQGNDDKWHTNITIKNCNARGNGGKSGWQGYFLSIMNFKDITIKDNIIRDYARFILVNKAAKIYDRNFTGYADKTKQLNVQNILVTGNKILSHKGTNKTWGIYCDVPNADNINVYNNIGLPQSSCYIKGTNLNLKY